MCIRDRYFRIFKGTPREEASSLQAVICALGRTSTMESCTEGITLCASLANLSMEGNAFEKRGLVTLLYSASEGAFKLIERASTIPTRSGIMSRSCARQPRPLVLMMCIRDSVLSARHKEQNMKERVEIVVCLTWL